MGVAKIGFCSNRLPQVAERRGRFAVLAQQRAEQVMRIDVAGVALEHAPVTPVCRGKVTRVLTAVALLQPLRQFLVLRCGRDGAREKTRKNLGQDHYVVRRGICCTIIVCRRAIDAPVVPI